MACIQYATIYQQSPVGLSCNADLPEGPGLGVEYDWDYIRTHSTGKVEHTV